MKLFKSNTVIGVPLSQFWSGLKIKSFKMKKLLYFILVVLTISSCTTQSSNGHLIGASNRPIWWQTIHMNVIYSQVLLWVKVMRMFPTPITIEQKQFLLQHFTWTKRNY